MIFWRKFRLKIIWISVLAPLFLIACASGSTKLKPAQLPATTDLIGVRQVWSAQIGNTAFPLSIKVEGETLAVANSQGQVVVLDALTGTSVWKTSTGTKISAGVGFDGKVAAVISQSNELIALTAGQEIWRQSLGARAFTAPLIAGGRVFVLSADRSVSAFDALSGRRLWIQQRTGEALVLGQAGVLLAVGDTLVAGLSGRLVGLNPMNGSIRWEAPIASPRGTNDVERLVDLVGPASRVFDVVCVRAFQANVGCVNAARGNMIWTKSSIGSVGLNGDKDFVFGVESDDTVVAWRRSDGERVWALDSLRYRKLSAPLLLGRSLVVGDEDGLLHFLAREDGSPLARLKTNSSGVAVAPVLAGSTLVVVTRDGGVYGFRPD